MQIGEVAARVGLSLRTIRHYDELGLVVPSERSAGGFRLYTEADVERLVLVKTLRPLDFSLEQMRDLLETMDAVGFGDEVPDEALHRMAMFRALAESRIEAMRAQVQGLERLARDLRALDVAARRRTAGQGR
ncbi:MAG: MerR family transcriptional regulator [Pseudonocardiales bacterium]